VAALSLSAGLTGCGGGGSAEARVAATPSPRAVPSSEADLGAGTYLVPSDELSSFDYTVTFPAGWHARGGNEFGKNTDLPSEVSFLPYVVEEVFADACRGEEGPVTKVGARPQDLVDALLAQSGPVKSRPVQTTLGDYPATRVDLRIPDSLQDKDCFEGPGTGVQLWLSKPAGYLVLLPQGTVSVYVVDVNGRRQVFTTQYLPDPRLPPHRAVAAP
jgi:hypothetical protein